MKTKHYLTVFAILAFSALASAQSWNLTGNTVTGSNKFLGTINDTDLVFKTNDQRAMIITRDQKIGIGSVDNASMPPNTPLNTLLIQNGLNMNIVGLPQRYYDGIAVWATSTQDTTGAFNTAYMGMSTDNFSKNVGGFFQSWGDSAVNVGTVGSATGSNNNFYPGNGGLDVPDVTVNIGVRGMADGANSLNIGLEAQVSNPESGTSDINYGARCNVSTTGADANYGVFGNLYQAGGTINYAIWGLAPSGAGSSPLQDTLVDGSNGTASYAGYFTGDVFCSNVYYYSDAKLKENIREYTGAVNQLRKLNIKQYTFKNKEFPQLNMPDGLQVGVLSNEMKAVFPDLVKYSISPDPLTGKKDVEFEAVNYNALIPVLVQAVKEMDTQLEENEALRKKVEEQEKTMQTMAAQLEQLANCVNELCTAKIPGTLSPDSRLFPCVPNPASTETRVDYFIGTTFTTATLQITDLNGRKKEEHRINNGGNGSLTLHTQTWTSGTYTYSLVIDGKIIDSKTLLISH